MYIKGMHEHLSIPDVLVVGAGPAATSIAAACADRGLSVSGVAPHIEAAWKPIYGAWIDELIELPESIIAHTWAAASVHTPTHRRLERPYTRLSTPALQSWLLSRCGAIPWHRGSAAHLTHADTHSTLTLRSGQSLRGRVVIDATGAGVLLENHPAPAAWQTACGQLISVRGGHPWPLDEIGLMDFRGEASPPTFLYAQPLDAERVFVEETSLIHRSALSNTALRHRLTGRLAAMGVVPDAVHHEEACRIQMLGPRPIIGQRAVGFGASAGMVHPATGYLLARVLGEADDIASALSRGLSIGPAHAAAAAWAALWPAPRQRQWALYRFGAQILCDLDPESTRRFFWSFFQIDPLLWQGFLSAALPPAGLAQAMASVFASAPASTRRRLMSAGMSAPGFDLLRGLVLNSP